ncbi:MAG: hypothetical protein KDB24_13580 [Microthrixaceae bacterium]|nr:hypothetical protein [Microthrixaceae bacterium]
MNGLLVGFTTSLPLLIIVGPIALMIVDTGLTDGVRRGWPAPLGVVGVDLMYGSVAAAAGLGLQRVLGAHQVAIGVAGGITLLALAVHLMRHVRDSAPTSAAVVTATGPAGFPEPSRNAGGAHRAPVSLAARFAALCAINPLTLVAFATLAVSAGTNLGPGWVVGIVSASLLVHGGFLVVGDTLGRVLTPTLIHRGRILGCASVAALGLHTLIGVAG